MSLPPSGHQITLTAGTTRAVVVDVGGGLRAFSVDGEDVLDGYDESELASGGRGEILAPWPNRLRDGAWEWNGQTLQLPLSEPALHNATHGLARWLTWTVDSVAPTTASLSCVVAPQPGYPFRVGFSVTYALAPGALSTRLSATNLGSEPAPVGLGMHPYLRVGAELVDDASLELRAGVSLVVDDRLLPVGEQPSSGLSGPIGDRVIDTTYGELARDADGLARVEVRGPDRGVTLWMDETWRWAQVFTGDTLPPDRRRRGVAVEPLTCPPDAFNSRRDLLVLEPGEEVSGRWGLQVSAGTAPRG